MNSELILPRVNLSSSHKVIDIEFEPKEVGELVSRTRRVFRSNRTKPVAFRKDQLRGLLRFLEEREEELCEALHKDLRKPKLEAISHEIAYASREARLAIKNLTNWVKPERPNKTLANFFDSLYIYKDPYGLVLIVGHLNFPVRVLLGPLIGAIAAGNCVIIKPSEHAPATARAIATFLPKYIDHECYPKGKTVHQAASRHLTPTNLQLESKNPVYVDISADMELAARRIMWGKDPEFGSDLCCSGIYSLHFGSPGKVCPVCGKGLEGVAVSFAHTGFGLRSYTSNVEGGKIEASEDYGRIYSQKHLKRLSNLLKNQKIVIGGNINASDRFIHPTIVVDVDRNDPSLQEEIFGPILPIVNNKPLAVYVFTKEKNIKETFLVKTSSGGITINDTVMHVAAEGLPTGIGKHTFDTFVHRKSVLSKGFSWLGEKAQSVRLNLIFLSVTCSFHLELAISISGVDWTLLVATPQVSDNNIGLYRLQLVVNFFGLMPTGFRALPARAVRATISKALCGQSISKWVIQKHFEYWESQERMTVENIHGRTD
ncbi:hypothetical protein NQ317_012669 [Molorchus minor]|uniref:Aldehyde dehydrogenase domain-containing protein n=1 Tax=Molorchus minor TaxID=1323400 RepID=A0ABQ9IYG1_9CUCU|nr:hypothetical protein NQ317_012669 [Molorchus minor]